MRILYIEDNPANISLLQRIARMGGHDVLYYNDGEVALSNFERDRPDLILVDLQLAGILDGLDVVRRLRADGVKLPIVAVTAYAMVGDKERCLDAGCDGYLAKPLPVADLVDIVQKYQLAAKVSDAKPAEVSVAAATSVPAQEGQKPLKPEDSTVPDRTHMLRDTAPLIDPTRTVPVEHKPDEEKAQPAASVKSAASPPSSGEAVPAKTDEAPKPAETPAPKAETSSAASAPPAPKPDAVTPAPKADASPASSASPAPTPAPKADTPAEKAAPKPGDSAPQEPAVSPNGGDTVKFAVAPQKAENGKKE